MRMFMASAVCRSWSFGDEEVVLHHYIGSYIPVNVLLVNYTTLYTQFIIAGTSGAKWLR